MPSRAQRRYCGKRVVDRARSDTRVLDFDWRSLFARNRRRCSQLSADALVVLGSHDRYCHRHLRLAIRQTDRHQCDAKSCGLDEIRHRWDSATIAATFYAPAVTEAHHIASAAAMALPIAERRPAIVLRDGNVDEARTLIAQLAKREFGSQLSGSLRQKQSGART